ncbi:MAG TPA: hypothetical protein VFC79_13180 [Tissierellaceae bacterium]|nr:hypothetical protein [Tissierellaceae bacterium]
MKRIIIDVYDETDSLGEYIEIRSEEYNFIYVNHDNGHGLQCGYEDGTADYGVLGFRLARLTDLIRKIDTYHEHTKAGD